MSDPGINIPDSIIRDETEDDGQFGWDDSFTPTDLDPYEEEGNPYEEGTAEWFEWNRDQLRDQYQHYIDDINALYPEIDELREEYSGSLTDIYEGASPTIQDLLDQIAAGPGQYQDEAAEYTASLLGFESADEMRQELQRLQGLTIDDVEGLTPEAREQLERQQRASMRAMETQAQDQLEAISQASGSVTRYLAAADDVNQQIADERLRYDLAISQEDYSRKLNELHRADQKYVTMIQTGQVSATQYMALRQQAVEAALGGYMQDIAMQVNIMQSQYEMEMGAIVNQAQLIYQTATLELGIEESILNQLESEWEMSIAQEMHELEREALEAQIDATGNVQDDTNWLGWIGTGAAVGGAVGGPVGAVVGGAVGLVGGIVDFFF